MISRKKSYFLAILLIVLLCFSGCCVQENSSEKNSVIMGSVVTVKTFGESEAENIKATEAVIDAINKMDLLVSKNNENASLYSINKNSGKINALESRELYDYIKKTVEIYSASQGKLSATSAALTELWGIDTDEFHLPSNEEIISALTLCSDSDVLFDDQNMTITTKEGQGFNLGSVGKGIACDAAAEYIKANSDINGAVISVGGSVSVVGMHNGSDEWTIGIRNPFGSENDFFATLKARDTFISTSGSYEKRFEFDGKAYHHILDLTTGYPVEGELCSVTIIAQSGLLSDALSTMCFCLGEEKSEAILSKYNAQAVFVYNDKTVSITDGIKDSVSIIDNSFSLV